MSEGLPIQVTAPGYAPLEAAWEGQHNVRLVLVPRESRLVLFDRVSYEPIKGVMVSGSEIQATTGEQGEATLHKVAVGSTLTLAHPDYADAEIVYDGRSNVMVPMTPYLVEGQVYDSLHDVPIAGAKVEMERASSGVRRATTDAQGRYTLKGKADSGLLRITAGGYLTETRQLTSTVSIPLVTHLDPFIAKGVYVPYWLLAVPDRLQKILDLVEATELNAIVVDIKSDEGRIAHASALEIAQESNALYPDLQDLGELAQYCKARDIYVIGRMVVFKDTKFAQVRPQFAIKRENGELYTDLEGLNWVDPFRQEVRDYNIGLAKEVAALGIDEIQFDYLRFPSDGVISDLTYPVTETMETRTEAIETFVAQAYKALKPLGVMVSADLFGLTAWVNDNKDLGIGQRIVDVAPHVDYLSLMLYPDTFSRVKMELGDPLEKPYELIFRSCRHVQARTDTKLRPWLSHYWGDVEYYLAQKRAAEDAKTYGWLFWNAGGKYTEPELFEPLPGTPSGN
jgi:hypothetical protein